MFTASVFDSMFRIDHIAWRACWDVKLCWVAESGKRSSGCEGFWRSPGQTSKCFDAIGRVAITPWQHCTAV